MRASRTSPSARLIRAAATVVPAIVGASPSFAQRHAVITGLTEEMNGSLLAFNVAWETGTDYGFDYAIYEAEDSTYDNEAIEVGSFTYWPTGNLDVNSHWSDLPQWYEFFIGNPAANGGNGVATENVTSDPGYHSQWVGIYAT
jgi:hypothetical protein